MGEGEKAETLADRLYAWSQWRYHGRRYDRYTDDVAAGKSPLERMTAIDDEMGLPDEPVPPSPNAYKKRCNAVSDMEIERLRKLLAMVPMLPWRLDRGGGTDLFVWTNEQFEGDDKIVLDMKAGGYEYDRPGMSDTVAELTVTAINALPGLLARLTVAEDALSRIAAYPKSKVITSNEHGDRETLINIARIALGKY